MPLQTLAYEFLPRCKRKETNPLLIFDIGRWKVDGPQAQTVMFLVASQARDDDDIPILLPLLPCVLGKGSNRNGDLLESRCGPVCIFVL